MQHPIKMTVIADIFHNVVWQDVCLQGPDGYVENHFHEVRCNTE
jgi:hypothetical protein